MEWIYKNAPVIEIPEGVYGFVYLITNKLTNQAYVGKKFLFSQNRVKVSGKKRRKIVVKESDWQSYFSSSEFVLDDIRKLGEENFIREILNFYPNKRLTNYGEIEEQFKRDVLRAKLPDGSPAYYNKNILSKFFIGGMDGKFHTLETKLKMSKAAMGKPKSIKARKNMSLSKLGTKLSKESIDKRTEKQSKFWKITFPDGDTKEIQNLSVFCREHDLSYPGMIQPPYRTKGFCCVRLSPKKIIQNKGIVSDQHKPS